MSTMVESGPGVWELAARGLTPPAGQRRGTRTTLEALPTSAHMMLVELEKRGMIKHLVRYGIRLVGKDLRLPVARFLQCQHGRASPPLWIPLCEADGVVREHVSAILSTQQLFACFAFARILAHCTRGRAWGFDDRNMERCPNCGKTFLRDYFVRRMSNEVHDHKTGRVCHCGGALEDTIVNFNEPLAVNLVQDKPESWLGVDLCLSIGSSLHIPQGGDVPTLVRNSGGRLVIVNLQATPMDVNADLVRRSELHASKAA